MTCCTPVGLGNGDPVPRANTLTAGSIGIAFALVIALLTTSSTVVAAPRKVKRRGLIMPTELPARILQIADGSDEFVIATLHVRPNSHGIWQAAITHPDGSEFRLDSEGTHWWLEPEAEEAGVIVRPPPGWRLPMRFELRPFPARSNDPGTSVRRVLDVAATGGVVSVTVCDIFFADKSEISVARVHTEIGSRSGVTRFHENLSDLGIRIH